MMKAIIRSENLGKCYRIDRASSGGQHRYRTLRDDLAGLANAPLRLLGRGGRGGGRAEDFWALSGLDFEVEPGEVVGVIGRNGAGKSTLLKVLSQITKPTTGHVELRGRVGSLLEVGTGFHPELTGRENIYLNGAILGMGRAEIARKFDEIVAFADIAQFLDTPVKRYSSGMYVRLAFSVAAHLDPEIMLVDEVLAVGDVHFQKKCLDKMGSVARSGRTVLLVSHNMAAIESLCPRSLLIESGRIAFDGPSARAIRDYVALANRLATVPIAERTDRVGSGGARIAHVEVQDLQGNPTTDVPMGGGIRVVLQFEAERPLLATDVGLLFETHNAQRIFSIRSADAAGHFPSGVGPNTVRCEVSSLPLVPGRYYIHAVVRDFQTYPLDRVDHALAIDVFPTDVFGTGRTPHPQDGPVFARSRWSWDGPAVPGGDRA